MDEGAGADDISRVGDAAWGRFEGRAFMATQRADGRFDFDHDGTALIVDLASHRIEGDVVVGAEVDLTYLRLLNMMRRAVLRLPGHYLSV